MNFCKPGLFLAAVAVFGVWACGDDSSDDDSGDGDAEAGDGDSDGDGDARDGSDASIPSGSHTCAELQECCGTMSGSKQEECNMAHTRASKNGESSCHTAYAIYQMLGDCP